MQVLASPGPDRSRLSAPCCARCARSQSSTPSVRPIAQDSSEQTHAAPAEPPRSHSARAPPTSPLHRNLPSRIATLHHKSTMRTTTCSRPPRETQCNRRRAAPPSHSRGLFGARGPGVDPRFRGVGDALGRRWCARGWRPRPSSSRPAGSAGAAPSVTCVNTLCAQHTAPAPEDPALLRREETSPTGKSFRARMMRPMSCHCSPAGPFDLREAHEGPARAH
jgi:hypothetical protein